MHFETNLVMSCWILVVTANCHVVTLIYRSKLHKSKYSSITVFFFLSTIAKHVFPSPCQSLSALLQKLGGAVICHINLFQTLLQTNLLQWLAKKREALKQFEEASCRAPRSNTAHNTCSTLKIGRAFRQINDQ